MKEFNHSISGCETKEVLAKRLMCNLRQINSDDAYANCAVKAACIFGITYGPLSSWGRILKKFLEILEINKPGVIEALIRHKSLHITKSTQSELIPLVVNSFNKEILKQPSKIGNTDYYYDTFTTGKDALNILRNIVKITGTDEYLTLFIRQ